MGSFPFMSSGDPPPGMCLPDEMMSSRSDMCLEPDNKLTASESPSLGMSESGSVKPNKHRKAGKNSNVLKEVKEVQCLRQGL